MQTVRRLVPNFIIEKYKANELRGSLEGAAIFIDLVGFSGMVDSLSAHGSRGAETLAGLMRDVFEPLVNAVYAQGGFVIGYAGDAFNAFFPAGQAQGPEAERCLASLVAMQAYLALHPTVETPFGSFEIALKAGMGYGEVRWQMFKSKTGKHITYWMRGASLNRAVFAEERAGAGEILIDAVALEQISECVEVELTEGAFRITKLLKALPAPSEINEPEPELAPMNFFFPEELAHQPVVGEFRHIINLFVDIPVNISDEALITPFMETVYALQEEYGGFFLRPELGDKGFNLLMFWGAPIAREHDIDRALNFVIELAARTKLTLRAGITYRTAYVGFIGAPLREDYTAYGWGITFAARLMTKAPQGEFWLDEEIARRAQNTFDIQFLGEQKIKGFTKQQPVYQLIARKSEKQVIYHGELVGRKTELETLANFIHPLRESKTAGMLLLIGEAGIGKSRLVNAFQSTSTFKDLPVQWISLQAEELVREAFNPFKPWLKKRFGIRDSQTNAHNWDILMDSLALLAASTPEPELASELKRTASILAALVNLTQPDSLYANLDAKARYENTFLALSALLRAESLHKPIIILLEDGHWLDKDTAAFLSYFMRSLHANKEGQYPAAIIVTQRPENELSFNTDAFAETLLLEKLSPTNIHTFAENLLDGAISDDLSALLNARAEGNPFFAEQILRYLLDEKQLTHDKDGKYSPAPLAQLQLPMDVHAVLIARLDRLTQKVRETVQTASVLGREFVVDVLVEMLRSQREKLPGYVHAAEEASIWAHISEIDYIFRHALLRDAAYTMQLEARQRTLHALACMALEQVYSHDLKPFYGELAYHAEKGALTDKALHYLSLAGDLAKGAYQNRQAIDYFTRALALLSEDKRERFELLTKRVECLYNLGDSLAQVNDLKEMDKLAHELNDAILQARSLVRSAYRYSVMGDSLRTLESASKAKELIQNANATEILLTVYMILPDALMRTGRLTEARTVAEEGLVHAQRIHDQAGEAYINLTLGLIALEQDNPSVAQKHQKKALSIAREIKDHYLEGKALNNLAIAVGLAQGDYDAAYQYFQQALAVFEAQGNQRGKGLALANLGWISSILGDYANAMRYYESSLKINRALGNHLEERYTYVNLSASSIGQGLKKESLTWANQALDAAHTAQDRIVEHWAYFYLGYAHLLNEEFMPAKQAFSECLNIRQGVDSTTTSIIEARAGLAETYAMLQEHKAAQKEAEIIHQAMENDPTFEGTEEPLRIYLTLYDILTRQKDIRAQQVLVNAKNLLAQQVEKLHSVEAQRIFVENVPWRKAIKEKAEK